MVKSDDGVVEKVNWEGKNRTCLAYIGRAVLGPFNSKLRKGGKGREEDDLSHSFIQTNEVKQDATFHGISQYKNGCGYTCRHSLFGKKFPNNSPPPR
jgi:hypothetical protein